MAKILIMDDEPGLRNIVYNMLKSLGHTLYTAEDGKQALETAKKEVIDLALLDMRVPDMDGLEVLNELIKIHPNIKCIMLSGFGDVEMAVGAIKQGAFDYISKPFKIEEVLKVVNKAIQTKSRVSSQAETPSAHKKSEAGASGDAERSAAGQKNTFKLMAGLAAIIAVAAGAVYLTNKVFLTKSTVQEFGIPYTNPTGICCIEPNIWVSDWVTGNIYQHNIDRKLSISSVFKTNNTQPVGLAFDGEYLWSCNSVERRIYKHNLNQSLSISAIYSLPNVSPQGLYFDGVNLWVIDSGTAKIYKHRMDETLSVAGVFESPAVNPCAMFRKDDYYFIADYNTGRIFKVSSKDFTVSNIYTLGSVESGKRKLMAAAWDGQNLWVCFEGIPKLFKYDIDSLKKFKI